MFLSRGLLRSGGGFWIFDLESGSFVLFLEFADFEAGKVMSFVVINLGLFFLQSLILDRMKSVSTITT